MQAPRRKLSPTVLRALAAALVLVAAASIALAHVGMGAAEDGDEQEESSEALQPTEVVADIPEGYGELFPLDWGGGSLYHLKGRLATMGCMANTLWLHDGDEWRGYNQYQVPSTLTQKFRDQYAEFVPPGRLYATCFRICEFSYAEYGSKPCYTPEFMHQQGWLETSKFPIEHTPRCTRDFAPIVAEAALPVLPLLPETCIMRVTNDMMTGAAGYAPGVFVGVSGVFYPISWPIVEILSASDYLMREWSSAREKFSEVRLLGLELHEICHVQQDWHIAQGMHTDVILEGDHQRAFHRLWFDTDAGIEFIQLTGFSVGADGEWVLPSDSVYRTIYSTVPTELAAELCMFRIVEIIGGENKYRYLYWSTDDASYKWQAEPIEFDADVYLMPEIRRWLETWVLLPDLAGQSDG